MFECDTLNTFLLKSRTRQIWLLWPHLFRILLEVVANIIKAREKNKGKYKGKKKVKLPLFHRKYFHIFKRI